MTLSRPLVDRLRTSRLLRAWLVVLALAGVLSGLHVASHIGGAFASVTDSSSAPGGGSDNGHYDDCTLFRLAGSCTLPLSPAVWLALLIAWLCGLASSTPTFERCTVDAALRWCQQHKHGPPAFSR